MLTVKWHRSAAKFLALGEPKMLLGDFLKMKISCHERYWFSTIFLSINDT